MHMIVYFLPSQLQGMYQTYTCIFHRFYYFAHFTFSSLHYDFWSSADFFQN